MTEFLVDRSLGRHVVPEAIRAAGHVVHTLWSVYGHSEQRVRDVQFLQDAGRNGWAVLTADQRMRWVPAELEVVRLAGVKVFALAGGNLTAADQAGRYVANLARIQRACTLAGPAIYVVRPDRIERKWP